MLYVGNKEDVASAEGDIAETYSFWIIFSWFGRLFVTWVKEEIEGSLSMTIWLGNMLDIDETFAKGNIFTWKLTFYWQKNSFDAIS